MNTYEVAKKIKQHLIDLAVADKFPLDIEGLDIYPIQEILKEAEDETAFGFDVGDVLGQAKADKVKITKKDAKEIIKLICHKGDASIGVNWETITYFTGLYLTEIKNKP